MTTSNTGTTTTAKGKKAGAASSRPPFQPPEPTDSMWILAGEPCNACTGGGFTECWKPSAEVKNRTACARCVYRQQHCSWPGQPPKPPRKVRKKDGPSGPAQKGQQAATPTEQPSVAPPATPAASTPAQPPRPAVPPVATTSKEARNNMSDKSGRDAGDADDDNVEVVQRPTTAAGTQSFLRSGLGWSETPEEDAAVTIAELQSSFLAELQEFRRNIRRCNADREEFVRIIQRLRRPMWMQVESIAASQARSDEVLRYFAVLPYNNDEESLHGEEPTEREESGTSDDEPGPEDSDDSEDSDSGTAGEDDSDSDATA